MTDYPSLVEGESHSILLYVLEHNFTALCLEILSAFSMLEKSKFHHRVVYYMVPLSMVIENWELVQCFPEHVRMRRAIMK